MAWQGILASGIYELFSRTTGGSMTQTPTPVPTRVTAPPPRIQKTTGDVRELADRVDELALTCAAMWSLLEEKTSLTNEDLLAKIRETDLKDGVADGKMTRTVKQCPSCGRTMSERHKRCLYCGAVELKTTPFEGI